MKSPRPVIVLEFNELSPTLIEQFIKQGELPNFARLRNQSDVYVTDAEEDQEDLEPWIQWPTVHTGLKLAEHKVKLLDEGTKLTYPQIWELASKAGLRSFVCGSMNINPRTEKDFLGVVLPDPWANNARPTPSELEPYFKFVQRQVQEHTNENAAAGKDLAVNFLKFMATHGLSRETIWMILKQLVSEKFGGKRWKRAIILDTLQWDLFAFYYKKLAPSFSTFFLNSTAHFQHCYWRNMDPTPFKIKPTEKEQAEYSEAVLYGYKMMDRLVGKFLKLADTTADLVLVSGLGQQPCLKYEDSGGKTFFRPHSFEKLVEFAGVQSKFTCAPVMSEEFHVHFDNTEAAKHGAELLRALKVNGRDALEVKEDGSSLFAGCKIWDGVAEGAILESSLNSGRTAPFVDLFYHVDTVKSGMHHPHGILWIQNSNRANKIHSGLVPLKTVTPTLLDMLGIEKPAFMQAQALQKNL